MPPRIAEEVQQPVELRSRASPYEPTPAHLLAEDEASLHLATSRNYHLHFHIATMVLNFPQCIFKSSVYKSGFQDYPSFSNEINVLHFSLKAITMGLHLPTGVNEEAPNLTQTHLVPTSILG